MRRAILAVGLAALAIIAGGCASQTTATAHPGTFNSFDNATYESLLLTDSVIKSTKADLAAGKFPVSIKDSVRIALNDLITTYNAADVLYCGQPVNGPAGTVQCSPNSYHGALQAGQAATVTQAQVQVKLDAVSTAASVLTTAKGAGQ